MLFHFLEYRSKKEQTFQNQFIFDFLNQSSLYLQDEFVQQYLYQHLQICLHQSSKPLLYTLVSQVLFSLNFARKWLGCGQQQ